MNCKPVKNDVLWITSEICYYLGLVLGVLFLPALTFALWVLSVVDKADPNYWHVLIAWVLSVLMFVVGVGLKNLCIRQKVQS